MPIPRMDSVSDTVRVTASGPLHERRIDEAADFLRVRRFLADRHVDASPGSWDVRMWDGAWHTGAPPEVNADRRGRMRVFEDEAGTIAALLLSQGNEEIHPQLHPAWKHVEPHVVARGEAIGRALGDDQAKILCWEHDGARAGLLEERGYTRTKDAAHLYRMRLDTHPPRAIPMPTGYRLRPTRPEAADREHVASLLNAGFGRTRHHAGEVRALQEGAPSFRQGLDLVAETRSGTLASYAAVCWDADNHRAIFEPVCTHPGHRRRGLARALMTEGLRRTRALGAQSIEVPTGDAEAANALYRAVGFSDCFRGWFWTKSL